MSAADDIVAIQQLAARYNQSVDRGDGDAFAATFVPDGVSVTPGGEVRGRDALADLGSSLARSVPGIRHWINNHVVDIDGDHADGTMYLIAFGGEDGHTILAAGQYTDQIRRTPDGWRFVRREFVPDV
jgi:ketosteroid isomerase-like protein